MSLRIMDGQPEQFSARVVVPLPLPPPPRCFDAVLDAPDATVEVVVNIDIACRITVAEDAGPDVYRPAS